MAKDKKKWVAERDPTGKIHWSHPDTWRTKGRDRGEMFLGAGKALFGFLVLFMLMRFYLESTFEGYQDPIIMPYGASTDLYGNELHLVYFDVFRWIKDFFTGIGQFKNVFGEFGEYVSKVFSNGWLLGVVNFFMLISLNIPFFIIKILLIPVSLIMLILGGPMYSWCLPGGWMYTLIDYDFIYLGAVDVANLVRFIGVGTIG